MQHTDGTKYKQVNLLLVCTGNIFRSASAGYLLKQHFDSIDERRFTVRTAGTNGDLDKTMDEKTVEELRKRGVDPSNHQSTKLTADHAVWADTIIAMADYHQKTLRDKYNTSSHLYNEFAEEPHANVDDIDDKYQDKEPTREEIEQHIKDIIAYLDETTPIVAENLQNRHFLFREFAVGDRDHHINDAPFQPLIENDEAMAFLSLDIPDSLDNHVLIIPRERYRYLDNIPMSTKKDMFDLADRLGTVFRETHDGYNIVVNNGGVAGQQIFHTHIHVIPREPSDDVDIEHWDHTTVDSDQHERLRASLLEALSDYQ